MQQNSGEPEVCVVVVSGKMSVNSLNVITLIRIKKRLLGIVAPNIVAKSAAAMFLQPRRFALNSFKKGKKLGKMAHLVILKKPVKKPDWMSQENYDCAPKTLLIRELKTGKRRLITTLLSEKMFRKTA